MRADSEREMKRATRYVQIIITARKGRKVSPFIYFIRESKVAKMLEEMEYQAGGYPFWCLPSEDPSDPSVLCDLEKIATRVCPVGGKFRPRTVTRCFHYCI